MVPCSRIFCRAWRTVRVEQETVEAISSSVILSLPCSLLIMTFLEEKKWNEALSMNMTDLGSRYLLQNGSSLSRKPSTT